jgi:biopolymer transport protein ExbB
MGVVQTVMQGDAISRSVALLLLVMSVASWDAAPRGP